MLSIFIAFLPALFMWEFTSIKVNFRLEKPLRKRLFKIGSRFALLALVIEFIEGRIPLNGFSPLEHALIKSLLIVAIPEELVKFAGVHRFGRRELDAIGPGIAILLAVGISLGFAVLENKLYVLGGGFGTWLMRAFTAVPMHGIFGLVMGSFLAIAWRDYKKTDKFALAMAIIVPILFHSSYDFLLMLNEANPALGWPMEVLPGLMLFQGLFAMLVTNYALNDATAIYGVRVPSDPTGICAMVFAICMVAVVVCLVILNLDFSDARLLPIIAVMPFVLALDLCFTAIIRLSPATR